MKSIDKILRAWRTRVAIRYLPDPCTRVFDIGCDDGYLLERLGPGVAERVGVDPRLAGDRTVGGAKLFQGAFPGGLSRIDLQGAYDAIFALAVFEHFSDADLASSAATIPSLLSEHGRLIITVPHPWVDKILDVLMALRLIDGQATEEHHGFQPDEVFNYFGGSLRLVTRKTFQLGLNNVFVFEKTS